MSKKRRSFSNEFKARVALEAIREQETIQQIAIRHKIAPAQVSQWKKHALETMASGFAREGGRSDSGKDWDRREAQLFRKIGQLEMERDWLKKKSEQLGILPAGKAYYD